MTAARLRQINPTWPTSRETAGGALTRPGAGALGFRWAAVVVGLVYAAVSVYWGLGGTALASTVGGAIEHQVRSGSMTGRLLIWTAVGVKLAAALLPVPAGWCRWPSARRWARRLSWMAAVILIVYGLVQTAAGLLLQAGVIHASATADHQALAWHAYLWDPWFLIWGLLIAAALRSGHNPRGRRSAVARRSGAGAGRSV